VQATPLPCINDAGNIVGEYRDASGGHGFCRNSRTRKLPAKGNMPGCDSSSRPDCTANASMTMARLIQMALDHSGPITSRALSIGQYIGDTHMTDNQGASSQCTGTVTVVDNTPPLRLSRGRTSVLWPPNQKMVDVTLNYNATDNCGQPACQISTVTSQRTHVWLGLGTLWMLIMLNYAAERLGNGNGRYLYGYAHLHGCFRQLIRSGCNGDCAHDQGKKK